MNSEEAITKITVHPPYDLLKTITEDHVVVFIPENDPELIEFNLKVAIKLSERHNVVLCTYE